MQSEPPVCENLEKWPALFTERQVFSLTFFKTVTFFLRINILMLVYFCLGLDRIQSHIWKNLSSTQCWTRTIACMKLGRGIIYKELSTI